MSDVPVRPTSRHAAKLGLTRVFFPIGFVALVRVGPPDPAVRLTAGLHVTRRRSGTGRPAGAEDGGSGDHCPNQLPHEPQSPIPYFRTLSSATGSSRDVGEPGTGAEVVQDQLFTGNGPSEDRKCWQHVELGIHGLKAGAATGLEKSEKRGVQVARNGPSEDRSVGSALSWVSMA